MKRMVVTMMMVALFTLISCIAVAESTLGLPDSISAYFSTKTFKGCTIEDAVDLNGHGSDNCWFVLIRNASRDNVLYAFKQQKDGSWKHSFHTSYAVPQTDHTVQLVVTPRGYEWPTDEYYSRPHLNILQLDETNEYTELSCTYELQNGIWKLHRIWSYIEYEHMRFRDDSITYYEAVEDDRVVGTAHGTIQRDLRYASFADVPRNLQEARAKLTFAPELPKSVELQAKEIKFTGSRRYEVYAAPVAGALRGGNGKAMVSTNGWIQVFGRENDWILIQYSIDKHHYRFGYIKASSLPRNAQVNDLAFNAVTARTTTTVPVTDDPLYSTTELTRLPAGATVTWLATMGNWAYVENTTGTPFRGFVPLNMLTTELNVSVNADLLIDAVYYLNSHTMTIHVKAAAGTQYQGETPVAYGIFDAATGNLLGHAYSVDANGYHHTNLRLSQHVNALQIMAQRADGTYDAENAQLVTW